jgi:hypothetical protein
VRLLTPDTMPPSIGYTQVATTTGGTLVFIAGRWRSTDQAPSSAKPTFACRRSKGSRTSKQHSWPQAERSTM